MTTRLLFFGALKEAAGANQRLIALPRHVDNVEALIAWLGESDEPLGQALSAPAIRIAVDQRMAARDEKIGGAREIAFMPPFSGG